jgi:Flp pilus assembly protein TadG
LRKRSKLRQSSSERGQALVEFALCVFLMLMLLIGVVEMCRMVLVFNTLSDGARIGTRYAIVHGSNNSVTTAQIQSLVRSFLTGVNTSNVTVTPTYPDGCTKPGCHVTVTTSYPYDPFTSYFPISVNLGSTSQGVITF